MLPHPQSKTKAKDALTLLTWCPYNQTMTLKSLAWTTIITLAVALAAALTQLGM